MPINLNNVAFNNGGTAKYNNVALDSIKYGSTEVWRHSATLTNLIDDAHEFGRSFSDIGYVKDSAWAYTTTTTSGHYYYFRFNVGCWGYSNGAGFGGWTKARHDGATEIVGKPMGEGLDQSTYAGHTLLLSSGQTWGLNVEFYHNNATQGSHWTKECMMVDVTALYSAGYTSADAIFNKIGFFRGAKEVVY